MPPLRPTIDFARFLELDIRVGRIVHAAPFAEARVPAMRLRIDFGTQLGERESSARITENYTPADLQGRQVLALVNIPPRQIGPMQSEVLVLGVSDASGQVVLVAPLGEVPEGSRLH